MFEHSSKSGAPFRSGTTSFEHDLTLMIRRQLAVLMGAVMGATMVEIVAMMMISRDSAASVVLVAAALKIVLDDTYPLELML